MVGHSEGKSVQEYITKPIITDHKLLTNCAEECLVSIGLRLQSQYDVKTISLQVGGQVELYVFLVAEDQKGHRAGRILKYN